MSNSLLIERKKLIAKRTELLKQAKTSLKKSDYEASSKLFVEIAEISCYLGEENLENNFYNRSQETHTLLIFPDTPLEPEVLSNSQSEPLSLPPDAPLEPEVLSKSQSEILSLPPDAPLEPEVLSKSQSEILSLPPDAPLEPEVLSNSQSETFPHKNYAKLDSEILSDKLNEKIEWFIKNSINDLKGNLGFFDPFQLIENISFRDIKYLLSKMNIAMESNSVEEMILAFYEEIQAIFQNADDIRRKFDNPINYLGHFLYSDPKIAQYFEKFDFISKQELIEIFIDFCADTGINVYSISLNSSFPWDLYLTKKEKTNKNGIAVIVKGSEILGLYPKIIEKLRRGTECCNWSFLVTTPIGVLKVGLEKFINDMEELGAWVYIIDRFRGIIYSFLKGIDYSGKAKQKEMELLSTISFPLRNLASKKHFSQYFVDDEFEYKSKKYILFGQNDYPNNGLYLDFIEKDKKNLQYLLFIHKSKGTSLFSMEWAKQSLDPDLISGLISAIDNFGSSFKDFESLKEIQYGGFTITFAEGKFIKTCLFLKENPSLRLKELLVYATKRWESLFENEIKNFSGSLDPFIERNAQSFQFLNDIFLN